MLPGDVYSHWHYAAVIGGVMPGSNITADFVWRFTLSDQQLNGYVFDIPFTLQ